MIDIEPEEDLWDWPVCPECQQRRQTVCPVCKVAGDDFPLGDSLPTPAPLESTSPSEPTTEADEPEILLMCETCDEAFLPRHYRLCEKCGHDFGEGIEVDGTAGEDLNSRVVFVLVAMVLLIAALSAFFAFVLRD